MRSFKCLSFAAALALGVLPARAGEPEILADLQAFFRGADEAARARLAERIAADPAFRRERLAAWLQRLPLYAERRIVPAELIVDVGQGHGRRVALRLPRDYDPERAWPLIYALHPSGGSGPGFSASVEQLLGRRIEEFVVAAPSNYRQTGLDAPPPFTADHLAILQAVRESVHVDASRQYALGYSLGGYASWAVACLHPDELAAAAPLASNYCIPPTDDGLWRLMVPNFQHLPIVNVWGERDELGVNGIDGRLLGTISALNRRLAKWIRGLAPLLENVELPRAGHGDVQPPPDRLLRLLESRRNDHPAHVEHSFRHLHQGRAYWLEAESWSGPRWDALLPAVELAAGENREQALGRVLGGLLGYLRGDVVGQTVTVETRHVGELTVWLGEGQIDWTKPVTLVRDGRKVFEGLLQPDLRVCLEEAARRHDLQRLRWAGVRVGADGRAARVTGETPFRPLLP